MDKPNFENVKNLGLRSFLEYVWKRIERERRALKIGGIFSAPTLYRREEQLEIFMAGVEGKIPKEWLELMSDFKESNTNPSGSDSSFLKRIMVDA